MKVELQSDLLLSDFWRDVRDRVARELREYAAAFDRHDLETWTIVLRPKTRADADFPEDPCRFNLTRVEAERLEDETCSTSVDEVSKTVEFSFPNPEKWADAEELAASLAEDVESLTEA